jgi:hypothetical protein
MEKNEMSKGVRRNGRERGESKGIRRNEREIK